MSAPTFADCLARLEAERPTWERQDNVPEYEDHEAVLQDGTLVRLTINRDRPAADAQVSFRFFDADDEEIDPFLAGRLAVTAARTLLAPAAGGGR